MARVNIIKQVKTPQGWKNTALKRNSKGSIQWNNTPGRYLIEWRERGRKRRRRAGTTPAEAREAHRRKQLELDAEQRGLKFVGFESQKASLSLSSTISAFLTDIKTFRKPLTYQKYRYVLELFSEYVFPKDAVEEIKADDIKQFLGWRKSRGFDPGTTLYTDRIVLNNFFNTLKVENPVRDVPKLTRLRKKPIAYSEEELQVFFAVCTSWEKALFALALSSGLRRGELKTLEWKDIDFNRSQVLVTAKTHYHFLPKDWEERTIPLASQVMTLLKQHPRLPNCSLVFPSSKGHLNYKLHDLLKRIAKRAGLDPMNWHLHKFRDTAATRWVRAGIDVRTVQLWLGHESLATTQKYLEPSHDTTAKLEKMPLVF